MTEDDLFCTVGSSSVASLHAQLLRLLSQRAKYDEEISKISLGFHQEHIV